jgi:CheY-like chemotaxis protein
VTNQKSSDPVSAQIATLVHELRNVLAAVRGFATVIVEDMRPGDPSRGDIEQILKAVDHGADVTARLAALHARASAERGAAPAPPAAERERPASRILHRPRRTATVLVVEDDDLVRDMTVRLLRRSGYPTIESSTAEEAEERVRGDALAVDLLLADVQLPQGGGPELAARLRQRWPNLKVLFMSGLGREAIQDQGVPPGAALLEKPFAPMALLERIDLLLASD